MKDFNDFLQDKHGKQYRGLDDNMPDDYNEWLENLSTDDWIMYGEDYALEISIQKVAEVGLKILN